MADYRLTQTGQQVQNILNQATTDSEVLTLHVENGTIHVTAEDKAAWSAKYNKPDTGIPASDLAAAVQSALADALSAYQKPNDGIPATDLADAVQTAIAKAMSAYQKPSGGIPATDFTTAVQNAITAALSAYQKPNTGIPLTDLAAAVQSAINASAGMQSSIDAERDARTAADLSLSEAIATKQTAAQVATIVAAALADYNTSAETASAISSAIATALTNYYTKTVMDTLLAAKQNALSFDQTPTLNSSNPVTSEGIRSAIASAVNGLLNTSQVQSLINTALASYSTTAQMNSAISTALASYITTADATSVITSVVTTALANYYNKTQVDNLVDAKYTKPSGGIPKTDLASAVQTSLGKADAAAPQGTTYTKTEVNNLLSGKQNTLTFDDVPTENSNNPVKSGGVYAQIKALQDIVADLETIAEGYVRVAGSENPALNYRSYSYHEQGGFGRESVFHLFYPCLVGTKLSGNDAQVGKILFVLKKFGAKTVDGTPMWEDINGNMHAIDGSEGDIQICNIEPYYSIDGQHEIGGTRYDVFLKSRVPFTWQGIDAEYIEKFGQSPDYCVAHQDTDNVTRMHSVFNPSWNGSYFNPIGVAGKYIYTTDPDTGDIVETYDANETLLGGAGGLHSTDITLYTGEQYAMNHNPDTTKMVPFANHTADACNRMYSLLLSEGGTFDAHKSSLMGSGFSANDGATAASDWNASGTGAKNGMRYVDKNGNIQYKNFGGLTANSNAAFTLNITSVANMINSWRNPFHIMEAQRAVCHAIQNDIHELEWFAFEGNLYKYRSVTGFAGPAQGEMTCVLWKMISTKFTSEAKDPSDGTTSLEGKRADFLISIALFHGKSTQVSPSWWTTGLVFTEDAGQNYESYIERDQSKLTITPNGDKSTGDAWPFESDYLHVGSFTVGEGYRKNYNNDALMLPNTNANKTGAGLHTYVGAYNWFTGGAAPSGKKSVRGFRRGGAAHASLLSPLTMGALTAPSYAGTGFGFGTCCRIVD